MNLKGTNKRLVFVLIGVIIFAALMVFVYMPLQTQAQTLEIELSQLEGEVELLEELELNLNTYIEDTATAKQYIEEQIALYPADVKEEDITMWLLNLESATSGEISTLTFAPPVSLLQFGSYVNSGGEEIYTNLDVYSTSSSFTGAFSYDELKNAVNIIYTSDDRTSIDSLTLTYDATTADLMTTFNISKYFMMYPEAVYEPLPLPQVTTGVANPFRTSQAGATAEAESAEDTEAQ